MPQPKTVIPPAAREQRSQAGSSKGPSRTYICRPQNVAGSQSAWSASTSYSCWVNTSGGPRFVRILRRWISSRLIETLKGDDRVKATTVKRQHVLLKKDALKGIKDEAGVKDWADDKNIAADRCASWMDGRFLQGTFTATRNFNDKKRDVNCAGYGGLSGVRSVDKYGLFAYCDGSVHALSKDIKVEVWKALATRNGSEAIPDF
jgi:hypothetical protein